MPAHNAAALRRALLIDAAASGAMALLLAIGAEALAAPFALPVPLLRWSGVFLVPYTAFLVWLALVASGMRGLVRFVVIGNVGWVVARIALLFGVVSPTPLGAAFVVAQAAAVALFAWMQNGALRVEAAASIH